MKKKFVSALRAAVKDFGLSDKAIKELCERGEQGIDDEATEDTLKAHVDLFANIARAMQGEVTRKVQAGVDSARKEWEKAGKADPADNGEDNGGGDGDTVRLLRELQSQVAKLSKAQEEASARTAEQARQAVIKTAAEKAGIRPDILAILDTSKVKTMDDADALFSSVQQAFVNNSLQPRNGIGNPAAEKAQAEADRKAAESWAKGLKDSVSH